MVTRESLNVLILNSIYRLDIYMERLVLKMGIIRPLTVPRLGMKREFGAQFGGKSGKIQISLTILQNDIGSFLQIPSHCASQ